MGKFDDYINVTAPLHSVTTKGKLGNANEIFTENDEDNVQNIINKTNEHIKKLDNRSSQMEESIKNISVTGGASVAEAVTYNNTTSGLEAVNIKGAVDELADKNKKQDLEINKKSNKEDLVSNKIVYNNETSGLEAGNVQEAIDEVGSKVRDLNSAVIPFTPKNLLGVVREVYVEGIEDKESEYHISVAKRTDNLQISIYKESTVISNYYSKSTMDGYDPDKKGIIIVPPYENSGITSYVFVDFSKLNAPYDKHYNLNISVATNLDFAPSIKANLYKTQIEQESGESIIASKWYGKTLLAIGDSVTSGGEWAHRVGNLLGMSVKMHAKGGIGIITMVDGDGSGDAPEDYDPNYGTGGKLYKLNDKDVANVDVICIMGFYNERHNATSNAGNKSDMYPSQNSFIGKLNYAIKRIYEELDKVNNSKCKIVVISAHKYGAYPYNTESAYVDGNNILEATKIAAEYNSLYFIDLMNGGEINSFNWKYFQNSSTNYNQRYIPKDGINNATNKPFDSKSEFPDAATHKGYLVTLKGEESENSCYESDGKQWNKCDYTKHGRAWIGDQLHPNKNGYERIGDFIAGHLLNI